MAFIVKFLQKYHPSDILKFCIVAYDGRFKIPGKIDMSHAQVITGASTSRLSANINLAIDKSLARKIDSLCDQIGKIETLPEQADRVRILRQEIINLEDQLTDVRSKAL